MYKILTAASSPSLAMIAPGSDSDRPLQPTVRHWKWPKISNLPTAVPADPGVNT
ncbi:hypothetical protein [Pseudorhodoferax sp.]|uniref:hypothetical protein n=1 Tax=Pseudorhodoferax sp. TaxID=1993553 RepID=UPI002DD6AC68|nr:hypothetical protein [Pseudorhodoferax sp.]